MILQNKDFYFSNAYPVVGSMYFVIIREFIENDMIFIFIALPELDVDNFDINQTCFILD